MNTKSDFFIRKEQELGVALNDVQKQAVLGAEGPMLLLATPGSGKTTTIIMRIGYLIEEKGAAPSRIKAITFSRASANDMRERFARFFPEHPAGSVDFSTIHSLAFEVVRAYLRDSGIGFELIEGDDPERTASFGPASGQPKLHKKFILRRLYQEINNERITDDQLEELANYISYVKNKLIPDSGWSKVKSEVPKAERILKEYEKFKRRSPSDLLIDYDDMLTIAHRAFEEDERLLRRFQSRYDYVLTDESQDTSLIQHALVKRLAEACGNLCVVADDDQSIYTWRAAEPAYLLDFKKAYPDARILKMEQNYRSSRRIVDAANRFVKRNRNRYDKNMYTANPEGDPISFLVLGDFREQAKHLAKSVSGLENLREAAVLYRNHFSSILLANEFDRAGIPFYMKDGDDRFFGHWVVSDVLDCMRMTFTDKRPEILERIYKKIGGYISNEQMAAVMAMRNDESVFDNLLALPGVQAYQIKPLQGLKATFGRMKGLPPHKAIVMMRFDLGYEKEIEKLCKKFGFKHDYLLGILNALEDIASELPTMEAFAARLKELEAAIKHSKRRRNDNAVTFSTLHSAKGLEFERVYMIDLVEGILPSEDDLEKINGEYTDKLEEAARLFYVGMTRAKKELELIAYRTRDGKDAKESRFVKEVRDIVSPPDESKKAKVVPREAAPDNPNAIRNEERLEVGATFKHRKFGAVKIVDKDEEKLRVQSPSGIKELSIKACLESGLLEPV